MSLTPEQRNTLVSETIDHLKNLGLVLLPVTTGRPWLVDGESVYRAYNTLAADVRRLMHEVDWPSPR